MIDEIFEMIMKEARSRPGVNLKIKAFDIINELNDRIATCFNRGLEKAIERYSKSINTP